MKNINFNIKSFKSFFSFSIKMKKILLITSKKLVKRIKEILRGYDVDIIGIGDIASLIKEEDIIKALKDINLTNYSFVLLPGNLRVNVKRLRKIFGIPFYLGTKHYRDLDILFKHLNEIKLSDKIPADNIIKDILIKENLKIYNNTYNKEFIKRHATNFIGSIPFGRPFPIRIIAEINNCDEKKMDEIYSEAIYYLKSGADIIDLGFEDTKPDKVELVVKHIKRKLNVPISIDTMDYENIKSGIKSGCDLILSFNEELLDKFNNIPAYIVLIPNKLDSLEDKITSLNVAVKKAMRKGFKIILDPILNVERIFESLLCYKLLKEKYNLPLLAGLGNITELIDADSIGINALLCKLCYEIGIDLILTTEASDKTKGSVRELHIANKMMYISYMKKIPPKDLGFDLLILKEKRLKRDVHKLEGKIIKAKSTNKTILDKKGYFKIFIDNENIYCLFIPASQKAERITIIGKNAKEICDTILQHNLVSNFQHAMYLARELQKAEFALKYQKSYIQDEDL